MPMDPLAAVRNRSQTACMLRFVGAGDFRYRGRPEGSFDSRIEQRASNPNLFVNGFTVSRLHRGGLIASLAIGFLQTPLPAFAQAVPSAPMTGAPVPIEDTSVVEPLIVQEEPSPPVAADAAPACSCGDKACVNDWLRMYGEFIYADSAGEVFNNRNIEENRGDAQNLLFDAKLFDDGDSKVTARVGRQELIYGNERLISPLDWANTRRAFDGYKLMYSGAKWDADGFFVHPTNRLLTNEDKWDSTDFQTDYYGLYTQRKGLDIGAVDFYYLGLDYQAFNSNVHTFGTRLAGSKGSVLYETEGGVQGGDTSTGANHQSEFFTAGLGRKLELNVGASTWKPTVWAWYDYASGGDTFPGNRFDDGFDHLFSTGTQVYWVHRLVRTS